MRDKADKQVDDAMKSFSVPDSEKRIFKYQFILNYLSKSTSTEKIAFIMKVYHLNDSFTKTVFEELLPTIKLKKQKSKQENNILV